MDVPNSMPDLDLWQAWHPDQVAQRLEGCPVPWCVAGGWAIDLHVGRQTREHEDLEIAIPGAHFATFRGFFSGCELFDPNGRRKLGPDEKPETPDHHQVWVWDRGAGAWRLDIFLEPGDELIWISHRDPRIRRPLLDAIHPSGRGVPYLSPDLVLFTKAQRAEEKDDADLANAWPAMSDEQRQAFTEALELVYPDHRWLGSLVR